MELSTDPLNRPVGLQKLANLACLDVHSTRTWTGNKFEFRESSGELLYDTTQQSTGFCPGAGFDVTLLDANNVEVIKLRRPNTFCLSFVEISIQGVLVSTVRQKATWVKDVLVIHDANDTPVYRIKGPWQPTADFRYELITLDKVPLGRITRKWEGWRKELFNYNRDDFTITFPRDLDLQYKAACLGASIFIIHARRHRRR